MTPSFDPIAPWPVIALAAAAIVALTVWAYRRKLRGTTGRWRWFAFGLRMVAVLLCVLAALRPSMLVLKKQKQASSVVFLVDTSSSMSLGGEVGGKTRIQAAVEAMKEGVDAVKGLDEDVTPKVFTFDSEVNEPKPDDKIEAKGRLTAVGKAMEEGVKRNDATKILRVVLLTDSASNTGPDPRAIAQSLGSRQVKVDAVGFGSETAGDGTKDVAVRDLVVGQFVYAKTELEVYGRLDVRGYPNRELDVQLIAEGRGGKKTVATAKVPPLLPNQNEVILRGLKWTPEEAGETKLTLQVAPQPGELIGTNNTTSTYVTVLKGGIGVLYLAGSSSPWERKFLARALDASEKIQLDLVVLNDPATRDVDARIASGKYDVIILGDLPADFLGRDTQRRLVDAVRKGAGLMMLGGRNSFGEGGWAGTEVAEILPVEIHPGDGQLTPPNGLKVVPNPLGLDSYVLKVGSSRDQTSQIWSDLPPIGGANRFVPKRAAYVWAVAEQTGDPLMAAIEPGRGRVMAFAGETWPWYRYSEASQRAHLNFWRNTILWLAHKEDEGETQVRLELDRRRVALGQKLDLTATARDAQGEPIPGVAWELTVTREAPDAKPERIQVFSQGDDARASYYATGDPGDYKVELKATKGGQTLGQADARFIAYDDDRELRNPAADLTLLKAIARESGGEYVPPESLAEHLKSLADEVVPEYETQSEVRLWDNWPFLLLFTIVLTLEWWLRKRNGWV